LPRRNRNLRDLRRIGAIDEDDEGCTEETQTHGEHARHTTGAERDAHRLLLAMIASGSGYTDVSAHCE